MPTRYIKESARTSKNLHAVSDFSERLFWRLITTADDYGRFLACAAIVKSACFPLSETMKSSRVEHALQEIAANKLIGLYHVGDRRYGWFVTWEEHQGEPRAKQSKYPEIPPHLLASVGICMQVPAYVAGASDTDTDTDLHPSSLKTSEIKSTIRTDFEQFWSCYPRKVGKLAARTAFEKAKDRLFIDVLLTALDRAIRSPQWTKEHGQFIPHPATWLKQGRWDDQLTPTALPLPKSYTNIPRDPTEHMPMPEEIRTFIKKVSKGMPG